MSNVRQILDGITEALGPAIGSLFKTAAAMALLGVVLAVSTYFIGSNGSILRGSLAAVTSLAACGALGVPLSWKRATGRGALVTVKKRRVGSYLVAAIFDRLLELQGEGEAGARGGRVAQAIERVPLNQAASKLRLAVIHQLKATPSGGGVRGWLRRTIEARLLGYIEQITLARFRDEASAGGGIDLMKVRDEVGATADDLIVEKIEDALTKTTLLFVAAAVALSIGGALGIRQIPL
jgi:hypothetical protein